LAIRNPCGSLPIHLIAEQLKHLAHVAQPELLISRSEMLAEPMKLPRRNLVALQLGVGGEERSHVSDELLSRSEWQLYGFAGHWGMEFLPVSNIA
jgi:hypothetical protein